MDYISLDNIRNLIFDINLISGEIALFAIFVALSAKKGKMLHRRAGNIYQYSLLVFIICSYFYLAFLIFNKIDDSYLSSLGLIDRIFRAGIIFHFSLQTYLTLKIGYLAIKYKRLTNSKRIPRKVIYLSLSWSSLLALLGVINLHPLIIIISLIGIYFCASNYNYILKRDFTRDESRNYHLKSLLVSSLHFVYTFSFIVFPKYTSLEIEPGYFSNLGLKSFIIVLVLLLYFTYYRRTNKIAT